MNILRKAEDKQDPTKTIKKKPDPREEIIDDTPKGLSKMVADRLGLKYLRTKGGKDIDVVQDPRGLFEVQFKQGGELPKQLNQRFTSIRHVAATVEAYLVENYADGKAESDKAQD